MPQNYEYERIDHFPMEKRVYYAPKCKNCRRVFQDGEKRHVFRWSNDIQLCEECKDVLDNLLDFNLEGSREAEKRRWLWMQRLCKIRDNYRCRIGGKAEGIEVHHIIPKKNGGTDNLKNLITLCEVHHKETYKNDYAGLRITDFFVQQGIQKTLSVNRSCAT